MPSNAMLAEVETVLPVDYKTARAIHADLGLWSHETVRSALNALTDEGRAEATMSPPFRGVATKLFRKPKDRGVQ